MSESPASFDVVIIGPEWGLPSMSPFGSKLATWVRMAELPHRLIVEDDPRKGPKGKSPWIVESDGTRIADSQMIIEHLVRTRGVDPDALLDPAQRATAHLLRRTLEEHYHQVIEYGMWVLDDGWAVCHHHFDFLPLPMRLLKPVIRSESKKELRIRGIARHTVEEIGALAAADLAAASTLLGDQPFFFGDRPTSVDCVAFGFLGHTLWAPIPWSPRQALSDHPNLVAFCERMRDRYWAETREPAVA